MIARLTGNIVDNAADHVVLDVNGVGYLVHLPVGCVGRLKPDEDGRVSIVIHTSVREDAIQLFGFADDRQKLFFNKVTSVSGVGPKTAMSVLSTLTVDEAVRAVANEDLTAFTRVSGIGKKTAERLLLELRGAVDELGISDQGSKVGSLSDVDDEIVDDLRSALLNLGYKPNAVDDAIEKMLPIAEDARSIEPLLRNALKLL